MASAPPPQALPPAPPPSGPTLGPMGSQSAGPVMGTDAGTQPADYPPPDQSAPPPEQAPADQWRGNPTTLGDAAIQHQQAATRYQAPSGLAGGEDQMGKPPPSGSLVPDWLQQQAVGLGPIGVSLNLAQQAGGVSALAPLNPIISPVANAIGDAAGGLVNPDAPNQPGILGALQRGFHTDEKAVGDELAREAAQQEEADRRKMLAAGYDPNRSPDNPDPNLRSAGYNKYLGFMMSKDMAPGGEGLGNFLHDPSAIAQAAGNAKDATLSKLNDVLGGIDKPRQGNIEHTVQQTLDEINGLPQSERGIPVLDQLDNIIAAPLKDWMRANPDRANKDATQGYGLDPTTGQPFTGPRAVWEDFISDKPSWQRILYDTALDPTQYIPAPEKLLEGIGLGGRLTESGLRALGDARGASGLGTALRGASHLPGAVADYAEPLAAIVHHPLQSLSNAVVGDWAYSSSVRAKRAEQAVTEQLERIAKSPLVEGQTTGAPPLTAAQGAAPNPAAGAPTNGHTPNGLGSTIPATANGHAPSAAIPGQFVAGGPTTTGGRYAINKVNGQFVVHTIEADGTIATHGQFATLDEAMADADTIRVPRARGAPTTPQAAPVDQGVLGVQTPPPADLPPITPQDAPVEQGVLGVEVPPTEPAPPRANAQRLTDVQGQIAQMAQTGEVPAPASPAQTAVQDAARLNGNAPTPTATPDYGLMKTPEDLAGARGVPGTKPNGAPYEDFGHNVEVVRRGDAHGNPVWSVEDNGVQQATYTEKGVADGAAKHLALKKDFQPTLDALKAASPADWGDAPGHPLADARGRAYKIGLLGKSELAPGWETFRDIQIQRVIDHGQAAIDQLREAVRKNSLPIESFNKIVTAAGHPDRKVPPGHFFLGGKEWTTSGNVTVDGIPGKILGKGDPSNGGRVTTIKVQFDEGTSEAGHIRDVPPRNVMPTGMTDHPPSAAATGIRPPQPGKMHDFILRHLPSPVRDHPIHIDFTDPIAAKQHFDHLEGKAGDDLLSHRIPQGTFTNPRSVTIGEQMANDVRLTKGWRDLVASGRNAVAVGTTEFNKLFHAGVVDATGAIDEGRINKQLVRLGLVDRTGELTGMGRSVGGAQTVDDLKAKLAGAPQELIDHLIGEANGRDWAISKGFRDLNGLPVDKRLWLTRKLDSALSVIRQGMLGNVHNSPRQAVMNEVGNGIMKAVVGGPSSAIAYFNPLRVLDGKRLWDGFKDIRITSDVERAFADMGLARTDILRETGPMAQSAFGKRKWLGPLTPIANALIAPESGRRLVNTIDANARVSSAMTALNKYFPRAVAQLPDELGRAFGELNLNMAVGHHPFPDWTNELKATAKSMMGPNNRFFSAEDLRKTLLDFYDQRNVPGSNLPDKQIWKDRFVDPAAKSWNDVVKQVQQEAITEIKRQDFAWDPTRVDEWVGRVFGFHFWNTRAAATYAVEAAKNPRYLADFVRAMNGLEQQSKANNAPPFLQYFFRYSQTPSGIADWLDPIQFVNSMATGLATWEMNDQADPTKKKDLNAVGHFVEGEIGSMLSMYPPLKAALAVTGALGPDARVPDPTGFVGQLENGFATYLNAINERMPFWVDGQGNPKIIQPLTPQDAAIKVGEWLKTVDDRLGVNAGSSQSSDQILINSLTTDVVSEMYPNVTDEAGFKQKVADCANGVDAACYRTVYQRLNEAHNAGPGFGLPGGLGDAVGAGVRFVIGRNGVMTTSARMDAINAQAAAKRAAANAPDAGGTTPAPTTTPAIHPYGDQWRDAVGAVFGKPPKTPDELSTNYMFSAGAAGKPEIDAAYAAMQQAGTPDQKWLQVRFNAIKQGNVQQLTAVDGTVYSHDQLMGMDPQERAALAYDWLANQPDGALQLQAIKDAQQKIIDGSPDLQGIEALKAAAYAYKDGKGAGEDQFIADLRAANPRYDAFLNDLARNVDPVAEKGKFNGVALGPSGYRALMGIPSDYKGTGGGGATPVIPGAEPGQTLQDLYQQQQDAKAADLAEQTKGTTDGLKQLNDLKARMDADDPSGQLWQSYIAYTLDQESKPKEQRDKYVPKQFYAYTKDFFTGSDGKTYSKPDSYALDYLNWAQGRPSGAPNDVTTWWQAGSAAAIARSIRKKSDAEAYDPLALIGGTTVTKDSVPPGAAHGADAGPGNQGSLATTADLNLRAGPGADQPVLEVGPAGTTVVPLGTQTVNGQTWVQVRLPNGRTGWMAQTYLAPAA